MDGLCTHSQARLDIYMVFVINFSIIFYRKLSLLGFKCHISLGSRAQKMIKVSPHVPQVQVQVELMLLAFVWGKTAFEVDCWKLIVRYWLLEIDCLILIAGNWWLEIDFYKLVAWKWLLEINFWLLINENWLTEIGGWKFIAGK